MTIFAVDLFCGAGGLSHGLRQAGISVRYGIDLDPACEYPFTKNGNGQFLLRDVERLTPSSLYDLFPAQEGVRLLVGCAPCQPFSTYTQGTNTDPRWRLVDVFAELIKGVRPEIVSMENVPRLARQPVFHTFLKRLRGAGYRVSYSIVDCRAFGVPQRRRRLVLLASRLGARVELDAPPRKRGSTVRRAIGSLPAIRAGERSDSDPIHFAARLSPLNLLRIRSSTPGGTWRDWQEDLIAACHRRKPGQKYPSIYGRMEWDEAAPTITTECYQFGSGRFGHPEQDRAISFREAAIIQGFPRSYKFVPPGDQIPAKVLGRLIGNAVPVPLGRAIGRAIIRHVEEMGKQ